MIGKYIKKFFLKHIAEISGSNALRWYGFFISLTNVFSWIFWQQRTIVYAKPICWTFVPYCNEYNSFFNAYAGYIIGLYGAISVFTCLLFAFTQIKKAYWSLMIIFFLKLFIQFHDYRLMGNYHYMSNIIMLLFLFIENKAHLIRLAIVGFYMGAGLIKFNTDWLSGQAFLSPGWGTGKLLEFLLAGAILLELFISQMLLSSNRYLRSFSLFAFIFFHIYSFSVVGWFYPMIMFSLLSIYLLSTENFDVKSVLNKPSNLAYVLIFLFAQLVPILFFEKPSITGQGRLVSLNMLDAKAVCVNYVSYSPNEKSLVFAAYDNSYLGIRIGCDPLVLVENIKNDCTQIKEKNLNRKLDFHFYARNIAYSSDSYEMNFKDVCNNPPRISLMGVVSQN